MHSLDKRLEELQIELPMAPKPAGIYTPVLKEGSLVFLSGQLSKGSDGRILTGKAGDDLSQDECKVAARAAALNVISVIRDSVGFPAFEKMIRVVGYVQVAPDFYQISEVINGASELFADVFQDAGRHVRSAVGVAGLPFNAAVELEVTFKIKTSF